MIFDENTITTQFRMGDSGSVGQLAGALHQQLGDHRQATTAWLGVPPCNGSRSRPALRFASSRERACQNQVRRAMWSESVPCMP